MNLRITALTSVALLTSATGCQLKKYDDSIPRVSGISLNVTASSEEHFWKYYDRISVIDSKGYGRVSLPAHEENVIFCDFRVENWDESKIPSYVCWPEAEVIAGDAPVIPTNLPALQLSAAGQDTTLFLLGRIARIKGDANCYGELFNPFGRIALGIQSKEEITSVTLSSKEGIPLCGNVVFNLPTISGRNVDFTVNDGRDTLTLVCKEKCFAPGNHYYGTLLPNLEFTPVFTFTDTLGRKAKKVLNDKISTSTFVSIDAIDAGIEFDPSKIRPDTIALKLEFGNWALTPALPKTTDGQTSTVGETYTYHYASPDGYKDNYPFVICKGTASGAGYYEYVTGANITSIKFDKTTAWISMPVINGMRIHKISMTNINTSNKGFKIQKVKGYTSDASEILHSIQYCNSTQTFEFNGPDQKETDADQQYFIYFYYGNGGVWTDLSVEYTKVEEL